jgi:hypothetical protein
MARGRQQHASRSSLFFPRNCEHRQLPSTGESSPGPLWDYGTFLVTAPSTTGGKIPENPRIYPNWSHFYGVDGELPLRRVQQTKKRGIRGLVDGLDRILSTAFRRSGSAAGESHCLEQLRGALRRRPALVRRALRAHHDGSLDDGTEDRAGTPALIDSFA